VGLKSLSVKAAAGFGRAALQQEKANPEVLAELAELCRSGGELNLAVALAERAVQLAPALAADPGRPGLRFLLQGSADWALWPVQNGGPVPFIRVMEFLPPPIHEQILALAAASLAAYEPSQVGSYGQGKVDGLIRTSYVIEDRSPFVPLFVPQLKAFIRSAEFAGAVPPGLVAKLIDLQVTAHPDGAFFERHVDVNPPDYVERKISFVYYFHFEPKPFSGGALVLYDGGIGVEHSGRCTRIWPVQNSIVFFPSERMHEVERVESTIAGLAGSRFSVNGWLGWKPAAG
jgi:hypothetical protein